LIIVFLNFLGFTGKLRNEVGAGCANGGWWAAFGNSGWGYGQTLGLIIFAFIIFIPVFSSC